MAGRHSKYFTDPYRITSRQLSDQGRANWDAIDWSDGKEELVFGPVSVPEESKPRITAPGPVFRMELNDLPQGMNLKDIMDATMRGETPDFVKTIEPKED